MNNKDTETFECAHKVAFPSREGGGKYTIYVKKDNGDDMTIYGEAIGAEGWQKGARLKITAEPKRQSKTGKWYQTAKSVELLEGEVAIPTGAVANTKEDVVRIFPLTFSNWRWRYSPGAEEFARKIWHSAFK